MVSGAKREENYGGRHLHQMPSYQLCQTISAAIPLIRSFSLQSV